MKTLAAILLLVGTSTTLVAQTGHEGHGTSDEDAVKAVIVDGYVVGMHINGDAGAAREAFHPEFVMHHLREGEVRQITLEEWTSRLSGERNEHEVTYEFDRVDVTENTATAKLRVFEDGRHIFTDYMGLYRTDEGWKIVNKIFEPA